MNKCFSPYPSPLKGGNEGGGGTNLKVPQFWGASCSTWGDPKTALAPQNWGTLRLVPRTPLIPP